MSFPFIVLGSGLGLAALAFISEFVNKRIIRGHRSVIKERIQHTTTAAPIEEAAVVDKIIVSKEATGDDKLAAIAEEASNKIAAAQVDKNDGQPRKAESVIEATLIMVDVEVYEEPIKGIKSSQVINNDDQPRKAEQLIEEAVIMVDNLDVQFDEEKIKGAKSSQVEARVDSEKKNNVVPGQWIKLKPKLLLLSIPRRKIIPFMTPQP